MYEVEGISVCPRLLHVIDLEATVGGNPGSDQRRISIVRVVHTILAVLAPNPLQVPLRMNMYLQSLWPIFLGRSNQNRWLE